jgi:YVTN family beta-propeller protein
MASPHPPGRTAARVQLEPMAVYLSPIVIVYVSVSTLPLPAEEMKASTPESQHLPRSCAPASDERSVAYGGAGNPRPMVRHDLALFACLSLAFAAMGGNQVLAQGATSTIVLESTAGAVAINPVTNKIYIANQEWTNPMEPGGSFNFGTGVTIIDGNTLTITSAATGPVPGPVAVNPVTNKIYVGNTEGDPSANGSLTVIDGATGASATIALQGNPGVIAVNPVTNRIYVSTGTFVTVVDGATNATAEVTVGFNAESIAVNTVTNKIYISGAAGGGVAVIDGATNVATLVPMGPYTEVASGVVAVNPVTNKIYVCEDASGLIVIDGATNGLTTVPVPSILHYVAVNPVTNKIYVADSMQGSGDLIAIDGATNATTAFAPGFHSAQLAVDTTLNKIYALDSLSNDVAVIDGASNAVTEVPIGQGPQTGPLSTTLAVDPVTNRAYVTYGDTVTVIDGSPPGAPSFVTEPKSHVVNVGAPVALDAAVSGTSPTTFQWFANGLPLADGPGVSGSATSTLFISRGVTQSDTGVYNCVATNSAGSASSNAVALNVVGGLPAGHLVNISSRAFVGTGADVMISGFVVSGSGSKQLILRGIGPGLSGLGVPGTLVDPVLWLYDSASPANLITEDSGWQNPPAAPTGSWAGMVDPSDATAADFTQVGAFGLLAQSTDSAVKVALPDGDYTCEITSTFIDQIAGATTGTGVALAEVYDADTGSPTAQLVNISTRAFVGTGSNALIAGFVIEGSTSQTVLIRAAGPALTPFDVPNPLPDPQLQLFDGNMDLIASSFGWGGNPLIASAAAAVGAFSWSNPSSYDSAILITLPPGNYTAEASGRSGDTGVALIEVYAVPAVVSL